MAAITIAAASVVQTSGAFGTGATGEAIDAGDWVALDDDDGKVYKAENSDETRRNVVGIAIATAETAGQRITYALRGSVVTVGSVVTQGAPYFLGDDGAMVSDWTADIGSGDSVVLCAIAKSATEIFVVADGGDLGAAKA